MIICIIMILVLVAMLVVGAITKINNKYSDTLWWMTVLSFVFGLLFLLTAGLLGWGGNYSEKARLENFYNTNVRNYGDTVNMSSDILSQAKFSEGLGSIGEGLAYTGQSTAVTKAIIDWRDAVNTYNTELASYKAWQENPWTSWFYYDIDAEFLTIQ